MQVLRSKAPLTNSTADTSSMRLDSDSVQCILKPMEAALTKLFAMKGDEFSKAKYRASALQFCCTCIEAVNQHCQTQLPGTMTMSLQVSSSLMNTSAIKAAVAGLSAQTMSPKETQMIQRLQKAVTNWDTVLSSPARDGKRKNSLDTPKSKSAKKSKKP